MELIFKTLHQNDELIRLDVFKEKTDNQRLLTEFADLLYG